MLDSELQGLCLYWQKELRLQDWDITAKFGIPDHISGAKVTYYLDFLEAFITICEEGYTNKLHTKPIYEEDSSEVSLIHEQLEIMFAPIRDEHDPDKKDYRWEQNYNKLARALVKLKYSKEQ